MKIPSIQSQTAAHSRRRDWHTKTLFLVAIALAVSHQAIGGKKKSEGQSVPRTVAPTWLHRYVPEIPEKIADISTAGCHYKPIFGTGDSAARIVSSVERYGEVTIDPNGACKSGSYPREEQIYVVLDGACALTYNGQNFSLPKGEFVYLPPNVPHKASSASGHSCRLIIMGFKIPREIAISMPSKPQLANIQDVREQTDVGHPTSVLYRLLLGNRKGSNDKIDCGIVVTSLFMMNFAPGGTNFPHRHEIAEEIYLVLDGRGSIVAGGGMNGVEGFHPATAGDAYFFRPNCTVGFYNSKQGRARILAVRSWVRLPKRDYEN